MYYWESLVQIDAQIAEAEVEMMTSSNRRRGESEPMQAEEEGRLFSLLLKSNAWVETDKRLMLKATDLATLLVRIQERLCLPEPEGRAFFITMDSGQELVELADLESSATIQFWARDGADHGAEQEEEDLDVLLGDVEEKVYEVTQSHIKDLCMGVTLKIRWQIEMHCEGAIVDLWDFVPGFRGGESGVTQWSASDTGKLVLVQSREHGEHLYGQTEVSFSGVAKLSREICELLDERSEAAKAVFQVDAAGCKSRLKEAALTLWSADRGR